MRKIIALFFHYPLANLFFDCLFAPLKTNIKTKSKETSFKLFEEKKVRTVWDEAEEKWYFVVEDVVAILCADLKGIFRIILSIPSPKAEPFKRCLAQVGSERIEEIENPELAQDSKKLKQ